MSSLAATKCPRAEGMPDSGFSGFENKPDDNDCDYCGSMFGDKFMERLEAGTISLDPTDKTYKVYVHNDGGESFKRSHRTDKRSKPGEIMKDPMDQSHWIWETEEKDFVKFYFQHLSKEQRIRFVELLNEKKIKINEPGHFYRKPFFVA